MKATTLIFIVLAALALWFLYNYLNKKSKTSEIYPGPGLVNTNTDTASVNTGNYRGGGYSPTQTSIGESVPSCLKVFLPKIDRYNSLSSNNPINNAEKLSIKTDLEKYCPFALQFLIN